MLIQLPCALISVSLSHCREQASLLMTQEGDGLLVTGFLLCDKTPPPFTFQTRSYHTG